MRNLNLIFKTALVAGLIFAMNPVFSSTTKGKPNILWIFIEDASCHISCYGETAIQTPNIDALAAAGVRFDNAFVTAPVCSPSRSALVTGMYQTTSGFHNHRSQVNVGKGGGNTDKSTLWRTLEETFDGIFKNSPIFFFALSKSFF